MLSYFSDAAETRFVCNASDFAIGAALEQRLLETSRLPKGHTKSFPQRCGKVQAPGQRTTEAKGNVLTPQKCYNCNKVGHIAADCNKPKRERGSCFKCGKFGHRANQCNSPLTAIRKRAEAAKLQGSNVIKLILSDDKPVWREIDAAFENHVLISAMVNVDYITITGDRYRLQLMRFSRALKEKRPLYAQRHDKVILLHDNARPHVAKPVKTYLETLKWEVLPHPLYSPDIAPSDFHLFRSMAHGLADRRFHSYEEVQKWIDSWIASKDMLFFRRGIHVLPERWSKVVESDGKYFH
ncbi:MOS1T transposase, partial [Pseudoatta argentina]